jgi:hypothetical protein
VEAPRSRLREVWTRRKGTILWSLVAILAVVVAVVLGVRFLSGAVGPSHHFSFSFHAPACGCAKVNETTYPFPTPSTVHFSWWVSWIGNNASAQLAIYESNGTAVYLAVSEYMQGNASDNATPWAQGGEGDFSGVGSPFTFALEVVGVPYFLPSDTTIWVNGTYASPLL